MLRNSGDEIQNVKPTLHMRRMVLRMMSSMMKFSKGGEVTRRQMW